MKEREQPKRKTATLLTAIVEALFSFPYILTVGFHLIDRDL
jgi:hypothetical protein